MRNPVLIHQKRIKSAYDHKYKCNVWHKMIKIMKCILGVPLNYWKKLSDLLGITPLSFIFMFYLSLSHPQTMMKGLLPKCLTGVSLNLSAMKQNLKTYCLIFKCPSKIDFSTIHSNRIHIGKISAKVPINKELVHA